MVDPFDVFGDPGVHSWAVGAGAVQAPAGHPG